MSCTGSGKPPRLRSARARPKGLSHKRGGFTLGEVALAMTILLVALMTISAATLRSHSLRRLNRERVVAQNAVRSMSERVHAVATRAAENSDEPNDWIQELLGTFGPGGTIGNEFPVVGLTPLGADTPVGTIDIILDETSTDEEIGGNLGMPRDLNGDGFVDEGDVSTSSPPAHLLPVVVRVRWQGVQGELSISHPFFILGF